MSTPVVSIDDQIIPKRLTEGAVIVLPTDTVYGLVARAADEAVVERLYKLKHRQQKPGTIIAASIDQLVELGIPARYLKAVAQFWPAPLTIIIPTGQRLSYLHLGLQSLAVRIPRSPLLEQLLNKTGPLLTTSANLPGHPLANTVAEAQKYFGDTVDLYVDGGDLSGHLPSTLIRVVDDAIEILRKGAVNINEKGEIL